MTPRYLLNFDARELETEVCDVLVVGSGIAGLTVALELSKDFDVRLLTKRELKESATWYAQGGIAAASSAEDSPDLHRRDTLEAGAGLCNQEAVEVLVREGPDCIGELIRLGAEFDWLGDRIRLGREGGHSIPRVLHASDATGTEIESTLIRVAQAWRTLRVHERVFALDLLTSDGECLGVLALSSDGAPRVFLASATMVTTGGAGQVYSITTNPAISTGDGMAMAYRAGAKLVDMEFVQFHPTALDRAETPRFLITEALRGEGAYLRDCEGRRFMVDMHPLAELAPRDVVTRGILEAMERCGEHVYLDARHIPAGELCRRFPTVWQRCQESGYDLATDLVPVVPAAHYMVGGVATDLDGRTGIARLYTTGETACTGVHGANRLASNSLLEGLVFSKRVARSVRQELIQSDAVAPSGKAAWGISYRLPRSRSKIDVQEARGELQALMTKYAGPMRSEKGLSRALDSLDRLDSALGLDFDDPEGFELHNMVTVARLIVSSALARTESRGVHFRRDFPERNDEKWHRHVVRYRVEGQAGEDLMELTPA